MCVQAANSADDYWGAPLTKDDGHTRIWFQLEALQPDTLYRFQIQASGFTMANDYPVTICNSNMFTLR
jgi:hypothetical protein